MNINGKMLIFVGLVAAVATGAMVYFSGDVQEKPQGRQVYMREENIKKQEVEEPKESYQVSLVDGDVVLHAALENVQSVATGNSFHVDISCGRSGSGGAQVVAGLLTGEVVDCAVRAVLLQT